MPDDGRGAGPLGGASGTQLGISGPLGARGTPPPCAGPSLRMSCGWSSKPPRAPLAPVGRMVSGARPWRWSGGPCAATLGAGVGLPAQAPWPAGLPAAGGPSPPQKPYPPLASACAGAAARGAAGGGSDARAGGAGAARAPAAAACDGSGGYL